MFSHLLLALLPQALPLQEAPETQSLPPSNPYSEALLAADRGLAWLASQQEPDGSWNADVGYKLEEGYRTWNENAKHVGVTALAGMAFLAGGHVPGRGPYGDLLSKTTEYILGQIRKDGYITGNETRMYSHAFATLFLAEVAGMAPELNIRPALQRAIQLIVSSQSREGGWRYQPHVADADMSVAACQVMALRAARNIGISVPSSTIDRAVKYVEDSAVRATDPPHTLRYARVGSFRYQPNIRARETFALTAAGVVILHSSGVYANAQADLAFANMESELEEYNLLWGIRQKGHYSFYYGHYYAVQAFHMAGGSRFRKYFNSVTDTLLLLQNPNGTWPNQVGPGTTYATAMACLILQIPKEYLPIFQN